MDTNLTGMTLHVLLIEEEDGRWSAQCLEYDIAAQAKKLADIHHEFEKAVMAQAMLCCENGFEPFEGIGAAPKYFWDLYDKAKIDVSPHDGQMRSSSIDPATMPPAEFRVADQMAI